MPKRIIEPFVEHVRSPITARALLLISLLGFIVYSVIHDFQQAKLSDRRHAEITSNQEEARVTRVELKEQGIVTTQALDRLDATVSRMDEMTKGIKDVAEILKSERTLRQQEHAQIQNALKSQARANRQTGRLRSGCYELRRRIERTGVAEVVIFDFVKKPKCN